MAGLPVLAIGADLSWRARLVRMLALRGDVNWSGSFETDALRTASLPRQALWLVDGDDTAAERICTLLRTPAPIRLHFYRNPGTAALQRCMRAGGSGCLDKLATPDVLLRALRTAGSGLFVVDAAVLQQALVQPAYDAGAGPARGQSGAAHSLHGDELTERQREIVHWTAQGLSNKQIARQLGISPETVKTHLRQLFRREGVSGRMALVAARPTTQQSLSP